MKQLLLLLSSYPFTDIGRERLRNLLDATDNWDELLRIINAHGITALAAYNLKRAGLDREIPSGIMAILENGHMQSVVRNTWFTERWKEVNEILSDAGIKHILLKGMALEHTLYGSQGLRQMSDNDVFIKPDDAVRAWHILKKEGFTHELIKSPLHSKIFGITGKHLPALYKKGYSFEIHNDLFRYSGREKKMNADPFNNSEEIVIGGVKALVLTREFHLKYLINHFNYHLMSGVCQLRLYTDIIALDPASNISFPDNFILEPDQTSQLKYRKATFKATFFSLPPGHRLRFITGDVFPSPQWMKKRYKCSGPKLFLYYPRRMGKLLWLL